MNNDEVTEFIIGRLAELVVVLLNEHGGSDTKSAKTRNDTRIILAELGDWAARNGRTDLIPMFSGLAVRITDPEPNSKPVPVSFQPSKATRYVKYGW